MMGNANEWVQDWFGKYYYQTAHDSAYFIDPVGADSLTASKSLYNSTSYYYPGLPGARKIFRGGSYVEPYTSGTEGTHRVTYRGHMLPQIVWNSYGFRMAKDL